MNYGVIICESLKIIFHKLNNKYRNLLPIILENILLLELSLDVLRLYPVAFSSRSNLPHEEHYHSF